MKFLKRLPLIVVLLSFTACDETDFEATWQDPTISSLYLPEEFVGAFLLSSNESARRSFEFNLASQLNRHGIEASPGYELLPNTDVTDKEKILADLKNTRVGHAVFMRIIDRHQEVSYVPGASWYPGFYYDPFLWYEGVYLGPGVNYPWPYYDGGYYRVDTIVSVETLIYSVPDSKLVWSGLSRTLNPSEIDDFVKDLVSEAVDEMQETGLIPD
jgi:hypothetical protein